jgi:hypothetical protein
LINPRLFREAIRSARVTYAVPFMFATSLLFAVVCLGGFLMSPDEGGRWLFGGLAVFVTLVGASLGLYGTFSKPDLLRSEKHAFRLTVATLVGDPDVDRDLKTELIKQLETADIRRPRLRVEGQRHD